MTASRDILLIESHPGAGAPDAERLAAAGHRVHWCWPTEEHLPRHGTLDLCTGVTTGRCPLSTGVDVALLVRARVRPHPTPSEFGACCAIRAGVPLVERGSDLLDPFDRWVTARVDGDDVVRACEEAADHAYDDLRAEVVARIRRVLAGARIPPTEVSISFEYDRPRLLVRLRGPATTAAVRQALGVRVLDAVHAGGRAFAHVDVVYDDGGS